MIRRKLMIKESVTETFIKFYSKKKFFEIVILLLVLFINSGSDYQSRKNDKDKQINNGRVYIPYTLPWDDMPIDLSFIYKKDKPAGNHGFLKVVGDKFTPFCLCRQIKTRSLNHVSFFRTFQRQGL